MGRCFCFFCANIFYKKASPYQSRGHKQAGKLGWEVVNYIMGDSEILPNDGIYQIPVIFSILGGIHNL